MDANTTSIFIDSYTGVDISNVLRIATNKKLKLSKKSKQNLRLRTTHNKMARQMQALINHNGELFEQHRQEQLAKELERWNAIEARNTAFQERMQRELKRKEEYATTQNAPGNYPTEQKKPFKVPNILRRSYEKRRALALSKTKSEAV